MKKKKMYFIIAGALVVVIIAAIIIAVCVKNNKKPAPTATLEPTLTPSAEPTAEPTMGPTAEPGKVEENIGNILIPGYNIVEIKVSGGKATIDFANPKENENLYDMSFAVKIKDQENYIFTTDFVKAGESIATATLEEAPEKGTYEAVLLVQPKRVKDGQLTNNCEINITLVVK